MAGIPYTKCSVVGRKTRKDGSVPPGSNLRLQTHRAGTTRLSVLFQTVRVKHLEGLFVVDGT